MHLTPAYKTARRRAIEEAKRFNQDRVGSEHLLLGLAYDLSGISGSVFLRLGINVDQIRELIQHYQV